MGGGGANLLDSPETGGNSDFETPADDEEQPQEEVQTYEFVDDLWMYVEAYNVPGTLNDTTITGSGTKASPYQINSTSDFLFVFLLSHNNSYCELNCDIYLNDEKFDENGTPSGGDGVVYEWPIISTITKYFDGNNHTIYGLYVNDPESTTQRTLFGPLQEAKNIKIFDFYISAKTFAAPVCWYLYNSLENVKTKGFVKGSRVGGMIIQPYNNLTSAVVKNCESWTKVWSTGDCGGGIAAQNTRALEVVDCKNYGDLSVWWSTGGIVGYNEGPRVNLKITNCENYGNFIYLRNNASSGGIVGESYGDKMHITITNCRNYGNNVKGGLILSIQGYLSVAKSENKGRFFGTTSDAEVLTNIYSNKGETIVNIADCHIVFQGEKPLISYVAGSSTFPIQLNIKNVDIDLSKTSNQDYIISRYFVPSNESSSINIDGLKITDRDDSFSSRLFGGFGKGCKATLKNILFEVECNTFNSKIIGVEQSAIYNLSGLIVSYKENGVKKGLYYGTDFSGFCVDWKTGKIGIKALSGKGFFQGNVTEEYLKNNKFEKKEI